MNRRKSLFTARATAPIALTLMGAALSLSACATAPTPATEVSAADSPATEAVPSQATDQATVQSADPVAEGSATAAVPATAPATVAEAASTVEAAQITASSSSTATANSSEGPSSSASASAEAASGAAVKGVAQATLPDSGVSAADSAKPVDPYQIFPALVSDVFTHADSLYRQGLVDSAVTYLQRFRVLKPLWSEWENRADSLLNEFGMSNAERAKQYEPLVLEIQNMNRVSAAYSLVAASADSLIALAPGDSLVNFAVAQKQVAYKNTLAKSLKEKTQILALAEAKAQFDEALKQAAEFQMRYRDFEKELQIEKMIAYIEKLKNDISAEDQKYWESNDPAKALAQVDELIAKKDFKKAKTLVEKLSASKLRVEAAQKYQQLAEAYCNIKRKDASQLYAKSSKQKDSAKKKQLLQEAIGALNSCSDNFPSYEKIKTVTDNIIFLKTELDR